MPQQRKGSPRPTQLPPPPLPLPKQQKKPSSPLEPPSMPHWRKGSQCPIALPQRLPQPRPPVLLLPLVRQPVSVPLVQASNEAAPEGAAIAAADRAVLPPASPPLASSRSKSKVRLIST